MSKMVKLELHEHCFIAGPRAGGSNYKFSHSHEGGDVPHRHPDIGPASYTIDKDDWFHATGMTGGGRKQYSRKPVGEQFPLIPSSAEETLVAVIGFDPPQVPLNFDGTGGGVQALSRMVFAHRLRPVFRVIPGGKGGQK